MLVDHWRDELGESQRKAGSGMTSTTMLPNGTSPSKQNFQKMAVQTSLRTSSEAGLFRTTSSFNHRRIMLFSGFVGAWRSR